MEKNQIKVLIAKPGLDGHDRGAKVVARALQEAGMQVIYTGIRQTPEMIVQAAIKENVNVIGLSCLSGAHLGLFQEVIEGLQQKEVKDIIVIAGGIIPEEDIPALREMGIKAIFGPGTPTPEIAETVKKLAAEK